jgi:acetoin:2,6-dichlorophenolindophenol oxidoreductase subunit beta
MPSVLESLNAALHRAFAADERVYLIGEDLLDPYGGAFKVSRGLSTAFPGRVLAAPVSEAGLVGLAAGMALRGLRPVVEIMFGDFITLAADQLVNHIAKFRWMYNDQVRVPLVIRTPMGGRRGYGPTHSQTLEKLFLGIPGLRVLAPCSLDDPGSLLEHAILRDDDPVLFVENKLLYLAQVQEETLLKDFSLNTAGPSPISNLHDPPSGLPPPLSPARYAPTYTLSIQGAPPPVLTIAAYGYMADLAKEAALRLAYDQEVFVELVVPTQLSPFEIEPLFASTGATRRLLVVEEGSQAMGWGSEIAASCAEALGSHLLGLRRIGAAEVPIPASTSLESAVLPGIDEIVGAVKKMV